MALTRVGHRRFPDDPELQFYYARMLARRDRYLQAIEYLLAHRATLERTHRAAWAMEMAVVYGYGGFEASARRWLEEVDGTPEANTPSGLYARASVYAGLLRWDEAIESARACVELAPRWARARGQLVSCLMARGLVDAAIEQLDQVAAERIEDATVDVTRAMLALAGMRFDEARRQLERMLVAWPQADFANWIRRTLYFLLVELGEPAAAQELVQGQEDRYVVPPCPDRLTGRHRYLPMPVIAQNMNQCVPTAVVMAAYPQGRRFDPHALFQEMHGREGTQLWRMRQWCEQNGFAVFPIRLELDAIRTMIDMGVPLIGVLEGVFSSHVDVICGYNDDLKTLYVRDPAHWALIGLPADIGLERYEMHQGVLAIVSTDRPDLRAVREAAQAWKSDETEALLDLALAVSTADLALAERAYAAISDDSPAAFLRDNYGCEVTISPQKYVERMRAICRDQNAPTVARFGAALTVWQAENEDALQSLMDNMLESMGEGGRAYINLIAAMRNGNWKEALRLIDRLLLRRATVARLWEMKSDVLLELGDDQASREALEKAMELAPLKSSLREKALQRNQHQIGREQFMKEFDAIMAEDPDDKRLLVSRVYILKEGPDGREFEHACQEALRWFPRSPDLYKLLLDWYRWQDREDLYNKMLERAHEMLPDIFDAPDNTNDQSARAEAPRNAATTEGVEQETESSEESQDAKTHASEGNDNTIVGEGRAADEPVGQPDPQGELPDDPGDLMDAVWNGNGAVAKAALAKLSRLQAESKLRWDEASRFTALQLVLISQHRLRDALPSDPAEVLPQNPPGVEHRFADLFLDILTDFELTRPVALAADNWLRSLIPDYANNPELWFKRVLLLEQSGKMEEALTNLQSLVTRFPGFASGLYRMGVVKYQQGDLTSARQLFEKALDVHPGLFGALHLLREIYEVLGQQDELIDCLARLRRLAPYSLTHLRDQVRTTCELTGDFEAADRMLQEAEPDFNASVLELLRADLLIDTNRLEEAWEIVNQYPLDDSSLDESIFHEALRVRLRLCIAQQRTDQLLATCEAGLKRWPESPVLLETKAEALAETAPEEARRLLTQTLLVDSTRSQAASALLSLDPKNAERIARETIQAAPSKQQRQLAELFAEVFLMPEFSSHAASYFKWAVKRFADSQRLYQIGVNYFCATERVRKAERMVRELYQRNPDDPHVAHMYGQILIDLKPKKAKEILQQVATVDRSVDVLLDLARAHQLCKEKDKARALFEEVIQLNPYVPNAWVNLFLHGYDQEKLWGLLVPMLERNIGGSQPYFATAAVLLAKRLNRVLPASWIKVALARRRELEIYPPYKDEKRVLRFALAAWHTVRANDFASMPELRSNWLIRPLARWIWPGTRWIPRNESTA